MAQINVDAKTNEIPLFSVVLDQIPDLTGTVVTVPAGLGFPYAAQTTPSPS